jgi:hypothetical protein
MARKPNHGHAHHERHLHGGICDERCGSGALPALAVMEAKREPGPGKDSNKMRAGEGGKQKPGAFNSAIPREYIFMVGALSGGWLHRVPRNATDECLGGPP